MANELQDVSADEIVRALFAGSGILSDAAKHLSARVGRCITRDVLAKRVAASWLLSQGRQIAEDRAFQQAAERGREVRRQKQAARRAARECERSHVVGGNGLEGPDAWLRASDGPNARAPARPSSGITPATLQAARDMRLCVAKTRKGYPCVRRVAPGRNRCVSHGGASSGPRTPEGRKRIADAQRERWRRYRQEHAQ